MNISNEYVTQRLRLQVVPGWTGKVYGMNKRMLLIMEESEKGNSKNALFPEGW